MNPTAIRKQAIGAQAVGALAVGALAVGALAIGALAIGRMAVGRLAVNRLAVRRSRLRLLKIDELRIKRLKVADDGKPRMRPQPLICVHDVEASSRWYQRLLGCESAHGGTEYERLVAQDNLVLQLHKWEVEHHHGPIGNPDAKPYGNGVLLWFELEPDEFEAAVARATEMGAEMVMPRHRNPPTGKEGPNHWECWVRDPNGYVVVLASPDGSALDAGE